MNLKFVLPILLLATASLEIGLQYWWHDRRTRAHKRLRIGLIAVLAVGAMVSLAAVVQDDRETAEEIQRLEALLSAADGSETAAQAREQAAIEARRVLEQRLGDLQAELQPFLELASQRHPDEAPEEALGALLVEMRQVRTRLEEVADATGAGEIRTIELEARLTCTLIPGAELPPETVSFMPIGDSHAYLERPGTRVRLAFVSPVVFRRTDDGVTVINTFALGTSGPLVSQPRDVLRSYSVLSVPIVTVVHGGALQQIRLLEVSLRINGDIAWYQSWTYDVPFQQRPRFSVPLDGLHAQVTQ